VRIGCSPKKKIGSRSYVDDLDCRWDLTGDECVS
jgi:hypothetical protein